VAFRRRFTRNTSLQLEPLEPIIFYSRARNFFPELRALLFSSGALKASWEI
jgi:hypothetical protein